MFDTIVCKYPLPTPNDPKGYVSSASFQTKDLDSGLDSYIIDENGQLFIERSEREWTEGNKNSESIIGRMGYFKATKEWIEQLNTTATIDIYDYQQPNDTSYDYSIRYQVIFINGVVDEIKLIVFEATDNAERKKRDEEFNKKLKEWRDFTKTRKYKYLLRPYTSFVRFVFRKISNVLRFLQSKIYFVEKFFLIK